MKILIVSAHPDPGSLTAALGQSSFDQFHADGHEVQVSDLYAMSWKSVVDRADFPSLPVGDRLRVAAASGQAFAEGALTEDVMAEQAKLLWADALILAFPLWWFSMPAILKGWIDRVFSYGFAYGLGEYSDDRWGDRFGEGTMAGKRAMLLVTAGGWPPHYGPRGINGPMEDLLFPINHGILFYCGYQVVPPFVVYQADRLDKSGFDEVQQSLRDYMRALFTKPTIPYRRQNGGDYTIPSLELREDIAPPEVSGFAAHVADNNRIA